MISISRKPPIFVVGFPRSGTTLLSAMLSNHPDIACGVETFFFSTFNEHDLLEAACDRDWPDIAIRKMTTLSLTGQRVLDLYGITENDLRNELINTYKEPQVLLDGLLDLYARREGKSTWLEKTPSHLLHLHRIRTLFPEARIIRMIRDPRDSICSIRKLAWGSDSILSLAYDFRATHQYTQEFFDNDVSSYIVKYEELVERPELILKKTCSFLGIEYDSRMLDTSNTGKKIRTDNESWKKQVSEKLDPGRLYVWRKELDIKIAHVVSTVMYDLINDYDYDLSVNGNVEILPCMNMTSSNIAAKENELIDHILTGVLPVPVSFRDALKARKVAWLHGSNQRSKDHILEKALHLLSLTPWFSLKKY